MVSETLQVPNHHRETNRWTVIVGLISTLLALQIEPAIAKDSQSSEEVFVHRVLPMFKEKCFSCHGDDRDEIRGQFNMLTRAGILRGGESEEPAVVPGKPQDSPLYLASLCEDLEMPPKRNDRLCTQTIE